MNTKILLVIGLLFVLSGCGNESPDSSMVGGNDVDPVVYVEDDDPAMQAAIEQAKESFDQFLSNYESINADSIGVKFGLETDDKSLEHIWFEPIAITETEFKGICSNDPADVPGLKYGDVKTFSLDRMSDWMIVVGNKCYGGFTIRVLAERQPELVHPLEFVDF